MPNDYSRPDLLLSPERWAHVRSLVEGAVALPPNARAAFLDASCRDDAPLRHEVERLIPSFERAAEGWGFLSHSAGELAAPLLTADQQPLVDPTLPVDAAPTEFCAALAGRYRVGAQIGRGGMAAVYVAEDLRHQRRVAIKVLDPDVGAMLGAERFLSEIRVTASLRHPNILPLFDSGEAGGLLYYVMPLIDGATLRARVQRDQQLAIDDAVRIVRTIASALDYAHREGIVHRDLKPENILLQDGQPLVADFGISLAVAKAAGPRRPVAGLSLGTPQYMSPEQAAGESLVDGRSDIYSLACVLYELLAGRPPFSGTTLQAVIAKVLSETPPNVRALRPSVPDHLAAALSRALAKLPADRFATAREFGEALEDSTSVTATTAWPRSRGLAALGVAMTVALASIFWMASRTPAASTQIMRAPFPNLIDERLFSAVTITPSGRALVYTGSAESGRPLMLLPLDARAAHALPGTEEGFHPFVSPDGRRLVFETPDSPVRTVSIDAATRSGSLVARIQRRLSGKPEGWYYGNGAWRGPTSIIDEGGPSRGLTRRTPTGDTATVLTRVDTAGGESSHRAPLVLPGGRSVVFTISMYGGPTGVSGPLAIASLDSPDSVSRHVRLGVDARCAIAFVDGWLLYVSADGRAIIAVRLDVDRQRIIGSPVPVLDEPSGDLETAALADNGTLVYVRHPGANSLVLVDSTGAVRALPAKTVGRMMYPRLSPDGQRVAVQTTTSGAGNDLWLYDVKTGTPTRLTTTGQALHPTWVPDGHHIVFMKRGFSGLMSQPVDGGVAAKMVPGSIGGFAPMVAPDGKSIVYQRSARKLGWKMWSVPTSGDSTPRLLVNDSLSHTMPAVSPDGHWLADVSNGTGRNEVYVRPFPGPGAAVKVSDGGGAEPAWSPDGRRIYYRVRGAFMSVNVATSPLTITSRTQLFKDAFDGAMPHRNYDVLPDGSGFVMISGGTPETVVVLNWLTELRARLDRAR